MTLYELGFMQNGMLLYEKNFYKVKGLKKMKSHTKGQLLDGVFQLTKQSMDQQITTLKFKKYRIVFHQIEKKVPNLQLPVTFLIYVIGDKRLNVEYSRQILIKILNIYFQEQTGEINPMVAHKIPDGSDFDIKVNEIIGDFYSTSLDRMMNLFL